MAPACALVVTMEGTTGVIGTSVSQRAHEFGVRMALGASRERVLGLVTGQGLALVGAGLAAGIMASLGVARVPGSYLCQTEPTDPAALAGVAIAFVGAGIVACAGPAWRATTVDPMTALRAD